jgi:hypothetical protein
LDNDASPEGASVDTDWISNNSINDFKIIDFRLLIDSKSIFSIEN